MKGIEWFLDSTQRFFAIDALNGYTNILPEGREAVASSVLDAIETTVFDCPDRDVRHHLAVVNDPDGVPLLGYQRDLQALIFRTVTWRTTPIRKRDGWPVNASVPEEQWMVLYGVDGGTPTEVLVAQLGLWFGEKIGLPWTSVPGYEFVVTTDDLRIELQIAALLADIDSDLGDDPRAAA